jgi:hypothetical protein
VIMQRASDMMAEQKKAVLDAFCLVTAPKNCLFPVIEAPK